MIETTIRIPRFLLPLVRKFIIAGYWDIELEESAEILTKSFSLEEAKEVIAEMEKKDGVSSRTVGLMARINSIEFFHQEHTMEIYVIASRPYPEKIVDHKFFFTQDDAEEYFNECAFSKENYNIYLANISIWEDEND